MEKTFHFFSLLKLGIPYLTLLGPLVKMSICFDKVFGWVVGDDESFGKKKCAESINFLRLCLFVCCLLSLLLSMKI